MLENTFHGTIVRTSINAVFERDSLKVDIVFIRIQKKHSRLVVISSRFQWLMTIIVTTGKPKTYTKRSCKISK